MVEKFNESEVAADLAIVGLGPGGLAAAYKAAKKGLQVVAFTNRTEYNRENRITNLDFATLGFLRGIEDLADEEDKKFWENYAKEKTTKINDVEKYIYRKLAKMQNVTIVKAKKGSNETIQAIKSDEEKHNYLELKNGKKCYFKHLLGADGAHHGIADLVKTGLNKQIEYSVDSLQPRHFYHATVKLKLKPYAFIHSKVKKQRGSEIGKLGWNKPFTPAIHIFKNEDSNEFYFVGEVPESIYKAEPEKKRELLKKWASLAIREKMGINIEDLEYEETSNQAQKALQATVFEMRIKKCQHPLVDIESGMFAMIGDARRTPNYLVGHGMNDAIAGGIEFVTCINANSFNKDRYVNFIDNLDINVEKIADNARFWEKFGTKDAIFDLTKHIDDLDSELENIRDKLKLIKCKDNPKLEENVFNALNLCELALYNLRVIYGTVKATEETNIASILQTIESSKLILIEAQSAIKRVNAQISPNKYSTMGDILGPMLKALITKVTAFLSSAYKFIVSFIESSSTKKDELTINEEIDVIYKIAHRL
ncbi:MAG: hypothetical protein A3F18_07075 [Legionellales bacterium RIFCSPHIGHO2_12_FULL_37_14]|nr:MAG: hypothetical protein A3F18_07075 [Legionellales bacterium RIFCSPHIGHO2_12_FULL_37_14]